MRQRHSIIVDGRYISDAYPGIGRYVFSLVTALATSSADLSLTLLIARDEQQTRFDLAELEPLGVKLITLRARVLSAGGLLEGWRAARRTGSALFHAPHILSPLPSTGPSLITVHDLIPTHSPDNLPGARRRWVYRALLRCALAKATALVTPSRAVGSELQHHWGVAPARITVTPYAADPAFGPLPDAEVEVERARLGLPERYVLYVGTNRPHKNLGRLMEAWNGVREDRRNGCHLVIAGAIDDERFQSPPRAAGGGNVLFLGRVAEADLPSVYRGALLLVHPALYEGFGLTVIEAMSCGVPVACSTATSLDEVCGNAARRFDPTRVQDITAAIEQLLGDERLRGRLASEGLARARQLSWSRTADLTLAAYRQALGTYAARYRGA